MIAKSRLIVSVINYKTPQLTAQACVSVLPQLAVGDKLIIIDNASGDGSTEYLASNAMPDGTCEVILHEMPINGGFSYGNNYSISNYSASLYLLLNSDAKLQIGAIETMANILNECPDIGLVGPLATGEDGNLQSSCFNDRTIASEFLRAANTGLLTRLFRFFGINDVPQPPAGESRDVDWLSFVAVMIRGDVIRDVGLMDDGYFMYLEDNDYCRRARNKGWRIRYEPSARVIHANKGWSGRYLERQPRFYYESRTRYFVKHYGRPGWILANLAWTAGRVVSLLREWLQSKPRSVAVGAWKDIWTWSYGSKPLDYPRPLAEQRGK